MNPTTQKMHKTEMSYFSLIQAPTLDFRDYKIEEFVQRGGWGVVYAARCIQSNRRVAMKFFGYTEQPPCNVDIGREIHLMMNLKDVSGAPRLEGIIIDTAEGLVPNKTPKYRHRYPIIVMEMMEGGDLFSRFTDWTCDRYCEREIAQMFARLIFGLHGIHNCGFIHRDLKLDNILFVDSDASSAVKISDFGLMVAVPADSDVYRGGPLVGSPGESI